LAYPEMLFTKKFLAISMMPDQFISFSSLHS